MQTRGLLMVLLIAATLSVDAVLLSIVQIEPDPVGLMFSPAAAIVWPNPTLALFLALACSQASLVATWVGLARRPAPWPVAAALVTMLLWGAAMSAAGSDRLPSWFGTLGWLIVLALQTLAVVGPLWMARLAGLRLAVPGEPPSDEAAAGDRPVQFSLGYLFAWMTSLAIVLGLGRWLFRADALALGQAAWSNGRAWLEIAVVIAGNAAVAWPAPWAVLGTRRPVLRALAPWLAAGAVIGFYFLLNTSAQHRRTIALLYAAQTVLLAGSLWAVRLDGYRLAWRSRRA